ncbi:ral guanine nucleotide dissociation stimulator-like isoform X1 [Myotis lucifugus]|uniref:ral guanine nucleotide dissociation stimulator-like isoform X1 n=1 Tax=Myotis lucifugus TaxID=59463 RepID=UPI000CCC8785|nr:ral guanine nucleotide dissociation stimulator-like isoform X1 [Myotis lucifugus]
MSLCCFPFFQRSGQKKAQSERCFFCCRNWCKCCHRHPSAPGRRTHRVTVDIPGKTFPRQTLTWPPAREAHTSYSSSQSSNQDVVEQQVDRFSDVSNRYRGQVDQARKFVQCQSESSNQDITEGLVNGLNYSTSLDPGKVHQATDTFQGRTQCVAEQTGNLHESCRMRALQEGTSEKVAMAMVPAFPGGIVPHVSTLALSRAQRFLDELFTRSCPPSIRADAIRAFSPSGGTPPYNDRGDTAQDQVIKAFAAMVGTWLDQVQGLGQPLPIACFEAEQALVPVNSPASHLVGHAQSQWLELQHLEPTEATPQGPRPELQSSPETKKGPAQGPEPGPRTGPALAWPRPRQYLKPLWSHLLAVLEAFSLAVRRVLGDYLK